MKRNAVANLIKDIILAVIAWAIFALILNEFYGESFGSMSNSEANILATVFTGIPFGWRWASKVITAISIKGIFIKLGISLFLGWIAIFFVLIGDVIKCIATKPQRVRRERRYLEQ